MTPIELHGNIETEINKRDLPITLSSDIVEYYINKAVDTYVRSKIEGRNIAGKMLEQTQINTDDLRTLVTNTDISTSTSTVKPNTEIAELPSDYLYTLDEEVTITVGTTNIRQGITECTSDTYRSHIDDVYSEHRLLYNTAKPLRLYQDTNVLLVGDGNYTIPTYHLRYLKQPNKVDIQAYILDENNGLLNLPVSVHPEIVKMAVRMILEASTDARYQSYLNEQSKTE